MTIRGRIYQGVARISYFAAVGLAVTACGKVGQQSFYQFDPNNSSVDISDSSGINSGGATGGSTSGGSTGGAGTTSGGTTTGGTTTGGTTTGGTTGSTSTSSTSTSSSSTSSSSSSTSSTSTSSTSSSSSSSGNGNGNGNGGGTTTGTSSSTTGGSSTTTGGAGGSGGTPTPKVVVCGDGETEAMVDFKCHTSASTAGSAVHCVFQGAPMDGALPLWFNPVNAAAPGCVGVAQDSIFAKLGHLPSTTGQYHFSGTLKACLPKSGSRDDMRSAAIMEFMGDLASSPMEGRVADHSPARKGNGSVSLDSLSGAPLSAGVCPRFE